MNLLSLSWITLIRQRFGNVRVTAALLILSPTRRPD
jgi:hypothetical protein